jgi:hypothetical protein
MVKRSCLSILTATIDGYVFAIGNTLLYVGKSVADVNHIMLVGVTNARCVETSHIRAVKMFVQM